MLLEPIPFIEIVFHMMMKESLKLLRCSLIYKGQTKQLDVPGLSVAQGTSSFRVMILAALII